MCVNSQCECSPGWQGNGIVCIIDDFLTSNIFKNCVDIDECQTDQICGGENFECQNSAGSFQCICSPGFVSTPNGCVDLDECSEGVVCRGGNTSVCVNKHGGFECQCAKGYTGHPESQEGCVDIDECDTPELYCGNKSKCLNTQGSYLCECFEGYEQVRNSTQCVDFNECLTSPCRFKCQFLKQHFQATRTLSVQTSTGHVSCVDNKLGIGSNSVGMHGGHHSNFFKSWYSFRIVLVECNCVEGFVGNGIECKGKHRPYINCYPGMFRNYSVFHREKYFNSTRD